MKKQNGGNSRGMSLGRFLAGWTGAYLLTLCVSAPVAGLLHLSPALRNVYSDAATLIFIGILATLQFLWLRRSIGISLRGWIPLALIGVVVGEVAFQVFDALVVHPFPPKLYSGSFAPPPEPEHIMQLKYALYHVARSLFLWSTPMLLQWLLLRTRFSGHGLWLLAALVHAPLTYTMMENGGILTQSLKLLDKFTEISLVRDMQPLGSVFYLVDWAIPTLVSGAVLYWILSQHKRADAKPGLAA